MLGTGKGKRLAWAWAEEGVVPALELIREHRGEDTVGRWLSSLLDPETSQETVGTLLFLVHSPDGFDDAYEGALAFARSRKLPVSQSQEAGGE